MRSVARRRRQAGGNGAAAYRRLWRGAADAAGVESELEAHPTAVGGDGGAWSQLRVTRTAAILFGAAGVSGLILLALPHGADFRPLGVAIPSLIARVRADPPGRWRPPADDRAPRGEFRRHRADQRRRVRQRPALDGGRDDLRLGRHVLVPLLHEDGRLRAHRGNLVRLRRRRRDGARQ